MKIFRLTLISLFVMAILSPAVLATAVTSSITRDRDADGRWSFTFTGYCNDVENIQLPMGVKETVGKSLKLGIQPPVPVDTARKNTAVCSYQCPLGTTAIALKVVNSPQRLLTCVAAE